MFFSKKQTNKQSEKTIEILAEDNAELSSKMDKLVIENERLNQLLDEKHAVTDFNSGIFHLFQKFSTSMGLIQNTLSSLSSVMIDEKKRNQNSAAILTETHHSVNNISSSMSNMADDIQHTAITVDSLNTSAEAIEGIINLIKNISDQTNSTTSKHGTTSSH